MESQIWGRSELKLNQNARLHVLRGICSEVSKNRISEIRNAKVRIYDLKGSEGNLRFEFGFVSS